MTHTELQQIRRFLDIRTHREMSNIFGLDRTSYTKYENGTRRIPRYVQRAIEFFVNLPEAERKKLIVLHINSPSQ